MNTDSVGTTYFKGPWAANGTVGCVPPESLAVAKQTRGGFSTIVQKNGILHLRVCVCGAMATPFGPVWLESGDTIAIAAENTTMEWMTRRYTDETVGAPFVLVPTSSILFYRKA